MLSLLTNKLFIGAVIAALLLSVLSWGLWQRSERIGAEADLATVTTALDAERLARAELAHTYQLQADALAERDKAAKAIQAERNQWEQRFNKAIRDDQTVRDWASAPLPDAVRGLLQ